MKKQLHLNRRMILLTVMMIISSVFTVVNAQITLTSRVDGNWNAINTWLSLSNLTGTITTSTGSATVTGSGTQFTTQLAVGAALYRTDGTTLIGTIQTINSNTSITLTGNAANNNTGANFRTRKIPTAADAVQIIGGFDVTATADASCASITYTATAATTLTINSGVTLTVSGAVTIPRSGAGINLIAVGAGALNAGSIAFTSGGTTVRHQITISTGSITVAGNIAGETGNTSGSITFSSTGTLKIGGSLFLSTDGTLTTVTGSTVEFNGAGNQTVQNFTYSNLTLSTGGTKSLAASESIGGNLTVNSGATLDLNTSTANRATAGGTLTVAGTLLLGATTGGQTGSNFPTNFNTITLTGGTVSYDNATGGQTVYAAPTYATLTVANTSGTQTVSGNVTATTLNTTSGGTLNLGTSTLSITNISNGGTIRTQNTGGTVLSTGKTWGGTVQYDGAGQTVVAGNYATLILSGSGTKTFGAAIPVSGVLSIATGVVANLGSFTSSANTLSLGGNGTNLGSFGSTASAATYKNNTFFTAASTGIINVTSSSCTAPTITLGTIAAVCQTATSFTIPYTATTGTPNQYSISGTGITTVTNATLPASPITADFTGTGTPPSMPFVLTVSNSNTGCISSNINSSVTVNASPTAGGTGSTTICSNGTALVSGITASNGTISWTENGAGSITANGTTATPTYSAAAGDAGNTVTLTMTVTNTPCAIAQATYTIDVNAQPQVSIFNGTSVCSGDVGQLTVTTSAGTGPFTVIYNPGAISESGVASGSPFIPTPIPGSTSNYTITSITDANGCSRTTGFTDAAATITINTNGTWIGSSSTDWFDGANWCGGNIPTSASDIVINSGGNQPLINASGAVANNITINAGATLTLGAAGELSISGAFANAGTLTSNASSTVEYAQASGTQNIVAANYGNLTLSGGGTKTFPGGTVGIAGTFTPNSFTGTTTGTINFNGTTAQTIPAFNYFNLTSSSTGSRTLASSGTIGVAATFTAGSNTYTSTGSTVNYNGTASATVAVLTGGNYNNLTFSGSGTYTFAANNTIGGNYLQSAGAIVFNTGGTTRTITVTGNFTQSGGSIDMATGSGTTNINLSGDLSASGTATMNSSGSSVNGAFVYSSGSIQTLSFSTPANIDFINHTVTSGTTLQLLSGVQLNRNNTANFRGTILVNNGGTIDCGNQNVTSQGTGTNAVFTISSGAKMITANATGVQGSVTTTNITASYNSGASYEFQGAATGTFTTTTANTVSNLIINRSTGVTLSQNLTATSSLDFQSGILTTGANTVTVGTAGSVLNADATKYVNGKLARIINSTTATTFAIGKGGNYRPAVFTYAAAPGTKTVTLEQFEAAFPVTVPASVSVASFGNRYWNITQNTTGTAFTIALNNSDVTPTGTARIIRSEGGGVSSSNAATFSAPNYSNSSTFATGNVSNNVALGETAIPLTIDGVTVTSTKVYDGNTTAALNTGSASLSGVVSPDVVTLNSGSAAAVYNDKHVANNKAITVSGFTLGGVNAGAYSLPTPSQIAGFTADITERPITVSAIASTKTYDGNNSSAGVPSYTLQPGDGTTTAPTQTFDDKNAGTGKTLTASGLVINDGNAGNNYTISYATNNSGVINARNLTVTAVTDTKLYDGNNSSSGSPTYTLQPGDVTTTAPIQTFNNANAGTGKTLTASGLVVNDGNSGNNYNISYANNNTGVINQISITVTPDAGQFKSFGSADPVFTYTTSASLISPDVFTGALSRTAGETLGTYPYSIGSLSAGGNYSLSLGGSNTFEIQAVSQSNADFRSKANGNFSAIANWEYDLGGGTWTNATQLPTSTNNVSIIHTVTLDQDYTVGISKTFALGTGAVLTVSPSSTLTVSGTANFNGHSVTFKSDATGTASLGQVSGTLNGATNVTVERYIRNNGFRSWRLLSVPTFGNGQTIKQAWQENQAALVNGNPGYGTQITTTGASAAAVQAQGFDNTSTYAALLKWNGNSWANETTTLQPIANQKAWFLFVRGDRSKGNTGGNFDANATTLRTNGTVYTGDQVNNIGANAFALVANVYPSAISFTGLTRTGGVSNLFYIWDSKKMNGNSLGAYQTFSGTNGFNCILGGGSFVLGQPNTVIESGQAFFVQSTTAGTITLKETAKINGTNGNLGFRPSGTPAKIDSRLYNSNNDMLDGNTVVFDAAYARAIDGDDAPKLGNPGINFAIETQSKILAIEGTQPPVNNDAVQFRMWNLQQQAYKLEFVVSNLSINGLGAELEDKYLNTSTVINLGGTTTVDFTVDANPGSFDANRFRIVFKQSAPLPITFISVAANRADNYVKADWKIAAERNIKGYEVERSTDGRSFTTAGAVTAINNLGADISYSFTDAAAPSSTLFYRIKSVGTAGNFSYSPVVKVAAGNVKTGYAVSPNPVENGIMNLQFKNQPAGKYSVRIISNTGESMQTNVINHNGGSSNQLINLPATMTRGTYQVEIIAPDKTSTIQSLFVSKQ